ncbi:hypothetical protein [Pseudophaeobacter sp.]|uniref:hypothetical protein n=1 Tax=Pseudophaeobacter sp. TaxID=1971739 RepID=UPI003263D06D
MKASYDPKAMAHRLEAALSDKGISMRKASLDAGFSQTFVHGILKLGRDPGVHNLTILCDSLGLSAAYVIFGYDVSPDVEEFLRIFQDNPAKREALLELLTK